MSSRKLVLCYVGCEFHCWLDCFANFVKIIVKLVPSGERLSICWVGGNLGIAPAAGASLFTAC